jgi:hypothetical protein
VIGLRQGRFIEPQDVDFRPLVADDILIRVAVAEIQARAVLELEPLPRLAELRQLLRNLEPRLLDVVLFQLVQRLPEQVAVDPRDRQTPAVKVPAYAVALGPSCRPPVQDELRQRLVQNLLAGLGLVVERDGAGQNPGSFSAMQPSLGGFQDFPAPAAVKAQRQVNMGIIAANDRQGFGVVRSSRRAHHILEGRQTNSAWPSWACVSKQPP